jgi:hypothetical protein
MLCVLESEVVDSRPDPKTGSNPIFGTKRGTDGMVRGGVGPLGFSLQQRTAEG